MGKVHEAREELEKWKKNEEWKEMDFTKVNHELDGKVLDAVTKKHDDILESLKLVSAQVNSR